MLFGFDSVKVKKKMLYDIFKLMNEVVWLCLCGLVREVDFIFLILWICVRCMIVGLW